MSIGEIKVKRIFIQKAQKRRRNSVTRLEIDHLKARRSLIIERQGTADFGSCNRISAFRFTPGQVAAFDERYSRVASDCSVAALKHQFAGSPQAPPEIERSLLTQTIDATPDVSKGAGFQSSCNISAAIVKLFSIQLFMLVMPRCQIIVTCLS